MKRYYCERHLIEHLRSAPELAVRDAATVIQTAACNPADCPRCQETTSEVPPESNELAEVVDRLTSPPCQRTPGELVHVDAKLWAKLCQAVADYRLYTMAHLEPFALKTLVTATRNLVGAWHAAGADAAADGILQQIDRAKVEDEPALTVQDLSAKLDDAYGIQAEQINVLAARLDKIESAR
jgi:hypothetical protein